MKINKAQILQEIEFKTSRSSGKGGQHVNKTESRVSIFFNLPKSLVFNEEQKEILLPKLKNRLDSEGIIQIDVEATRSQLKNKELAIKRLIELLEENLKVNRKRKATKPTKAAIQKRLKYKKHNSEKKQNRKFKH